MPQNWRTAGAVAQATKSTPVLQGREFAAQAVVKARGRTSDHAGHVVDHRFMLDQGMANLFPQDANFNLSAFKALGNDYARLIDKGYSVDFEHKRGDFDETGRPGSVFVEYRAFAPDGTEMTHWKGSFANEPGQVYKRGVF